MNKKEALRERRVFNPYEFYGKTPYISYRTKAGSRDVYPAGWYVTQRDVDLTNGTGHYNDRGRKFFTGYASKAEGRTSRDRALKDAIAWAKERFGIEEWKRDPFGSYGPAEYVESRLAALLQKEEK